MQGAGRDGQVQDRYSSYQAGPNNRFTQKQDIRVTEDSRQQRPARVRAEENVRVYQDDKYTDRRDTRVEVDRQG